ncbi:hypothetical protein [Kribbella solani]|uniref:hypothetical protein n=1 Tax=Kribbella solani TaxID=236067 RepID=UPI0029B8036B|nr:hypothetical protein [Kribbella solani]MDX2971088.1 hypothetical protein [Kribbella solani]
MTESDEWDRIARLRQQAMAHPGRRAFVLWSAWRTVVDILVFNHRDLVEHLNEPNEKLDSALEIIRNDGARKDPDYHTEFYRLLHNYLASVMTLVDHSRNLSKRYSANDNFRSNYQERVDRIREIPVAKFVQELRHVVVHAQLPQIASTITVDPAGHPVHELTVDRAALLGALDWSASAREYIQGQPEHFALRTALDAYMAEAMTLSAWIAPQFRELHGPEYEDYERLLDEMLRPGGGHA